MADVTLTNSQKEVEESDPADVQPVDDMRDSPAEIARYAKPLANALRHFQETFAASFAGYDRQAKKEQQRHRVIVSVFCVAGSLAVVFSILHLTRLLPLGDYPQFTKYLAVGLFLGELLAVVLAVFAVGFGLLRAFQRNWLVTRHKSESLRLLKFGSLIDPILLSGSDEDFQKWTRTLSDEAQTIKAMDHDSVHEVVEEATIPDACPTPLSPKIDDQTILDLLDYYKKKRLNPQARYFYERAQRNLHWDWYTRLLPPALFFASVFFAVLHLFHEVWEFRYLGGDEYFNNWTRIANKWSILFIVLAASLPAVSAALRGLRSAYEFSRNTLRLKANHFALELLRDRLHRENRPEAILNSLWWCELLLQAEHREWLRLMIEAEWIG